MPISKFQIKDVGPLKHVEASNLPSIVIIAGPNGVGKSTLLETLKKRRGNVSIEGTGNFLYIPPYRTPVTFSLHRSLPFIGPRQKFRDILALDNFSFSAPGISIPYYLTSGSARSRSTPDFALYFEVKYKLAQIQQEFEHALAEVFKKLGGEIPKGYMPEDIYRPFRSLVSNLLPGIQFQQVILEGDIYHIYFVNRMKVRVEFDQLSSGEKDIIALLFPFIEREIENELAKAKGEEIPHEDLVILIDTPEAYLHPSLQRNLLEYIRNSVREAGREGEKLQFFVATHSTTIINEATPEELYILLFPDQSSHGNQITKITGDKEKLSLIREIMGDIGIASLATGKPILLLEGPTDLEILALLKPEIKENFTLLPCRGKGEILRFSQILVELVQELRSRGFRIFAILDKDSEETKTAAEFCFSWPRSCIENFLLLNSEAVYEALNVEAGEAKLRDEGIETKEDIERLISEIIRDPEILRREMKKRIERELKLHIGDSWENLEELKKMASEVIQKKLDRVEKRYKELSQEIEQIKTKREKALIELDGKIILGKIASKFKVKREALARNIANKLREMNKVPQEISDMIGQIEALH